MAESNYRVIFDVKCGACGQTLETGVSEDGVGVEYRHANTDDCDQPTVWLPAVTPEVLLEILDAHTSSKKPAKTPAKKKGK